MPTEQYNYLSLEGDLDKKESLLPENSLLKNDSSIFLEDDNFISIQTQKTQEIEGKTKEDKEKK